MIYFAQNLKAEEIKIGYAADATIRMKQHKGYGFTLICALPGSQESEERLHKYFKQLKCRGDEFYSCDDAILGYCANLIEKGFAHPDAALAEHLPELPFSAWGPESLETNAVEANGQISLLKILPARNRLKIAAAQAQNHSFTDEWYTPEYLVDLVRSVLGRIDTDPATSFAVNLKFIKAPIFYTKHTNGLDQTRPWSGNVFLNPPYGRGEGSASEFIFRLCNEIKAGNVNQAITCLNVASTTAKWFYTQIPSIVSAHCIVNGRPNFIPPDGKSQRSSPNKGIVLSYFGGATYLFAKRCEAYGQILRPVDMFNAEMWSKPFDNPELL